jgi:ribosome modulation factor
MNVTVTLGLPPLLLHRATAAGRRAGIARRAGERYERCPFRLEDPSITRSRQAAAWFQAFADVAGLSDPGTCEHPH